MWISASYESTALFSLKPASATASGGKTLLVPTPFAIKMALLDVACRVEGQHVAAEAWESFGNAPIALKPAAAVVVNNTFIKILKPRRNPVAPGTQDAGYFMRTITYREYAQLAGEFGIALYVEDEGYAETLGNWLMCLNYLGKRGSFIQLVDLPSIDEHLPSEYILVDGELTDFPINAVLTQLDDVGEGMTFEHADIYSSKSIRLGKERVLKHVALPYQLTSSSRGYSFYQLTAEQT